jgi:hypothetical protein
MGRSAINQLIELHDSEIAAIDFDSGTAIVVFSHAYIHRSEGEPGRGPGTGWSQRAELVIAQAEVVGLTRAWPCTIFNGSLEMDGRILDNSIPIPLAVEGNVRLKLEVMDSDENFTAIEICGNGARLSLLGEARYLEDFPGQSLPKEDNGSVGTTAATFPMNGLQASTQAAQQPKGDEISATATGEC